jgi:hypothetical protein
MNEKIWEFKSGFSDLNRATHSVVNPYPKISCGWLSAGRIPSKRSIS